MRSYTSLPLAGERGTTFCQVAFKTNFQASHRLYLKTKFTGVVESPYQAVFYNKLKGPSTVRQALFITTIFGHAYGFFVVKKLRYDGPPPSLRREVSFVSTTLLENGQPLVVPKIVCSLFTSHNFDHCANSHSLHRPQGAVVFLALPISSKMKQGCKASQHFNFIGRYA